MPATATSHTTYRTRRPATLLLSALGGLMLAVAAPAVAEAHVGISADSTAAGSEALLTLNVPHGCEGSPTTVIAVRIPAEITVVTPTVHPGWAVTKKTSKLAEPVSTDGGDTLSTRTTEVIWTARTPLPDGYRDSLSLQVQLPADAAGHRLAFPTVQTCTEGETAWTQVPAAGQDHDELEHPAPTIAVTAAAPGEHQHEAGSEAVPEAAPSPVTPVGDTLTGTPSGATGSGATTGVVGLVLGALGLLAGGTALVRTRNVPRMTRAE